MIACSPDEFLTPWSSLGLQRFNLEGGIDGGLRDHFADGITGGGRCNPRRRVAPALELPAAPARRGACDRRGAARGCLADAGRAVRLDGGRDARSPRRR